MTTSKSTRNTGPDPAGGFDRLIDRLDALVDRIEQLVPPSAPPPDWECHDRLPLAQARRPRAARSRSPSAPDPALGPARHRPAEGAGRAEHPPVRRRPAGQQRAAHRRARHRQKLAHQGAAQPLPPRGPAPDRGGQAGPRRPAGIVDLVGGRPERFVIFCDDLSFEASEAGYKALKVALDGSIAATSENVLIYATSNRRHLMPEYMQENLEYQARRRGDPSGRDVGGEDLALGALRPVGLVLSRSTRTSTSRSSRTG